MSLLNRFKTAFSGVDRGVDEPSGLVEDQAGVVYYIKPDGTRVEVGGGGGSQPAQEQVSAGATSVPDDTYTALPMGHGSGDALLSYADPANPTFVDAGVYAANCRVSCLDGSQVGHEAIAEVALNEGVRGANLLTTFDLETDLADGAVAVLTLVTQVEAGESLGFFVYHEVGVPVFFNVVIYLQKIL